MISIYDLNFSFLCVTDKMFIEVPLFQENLPAMKNSWLRACSYHDAT